MIVCYVSSLFMYVIFYVGFDKFQIVRTQVDGPLVMKKGGKFSEVQGVKRKKIQASHDLFESLNFASYVVRIQLSQVDQQSQQCLFLINKYTYESMISHDILVKFHHLKGQNDIFFLWIFLQFLLSKNLFVILIFITLMFCHIRNFLIYMQIRHLVTTDTELEHLRFFLIYQPLGILLNHQVVESLL